MTTPRRGVAGAGLWGLALLIVALSSGLAVAQGFQWPWETEERPRRPVERPAPQPAPDPYESRGGNNTDYGGWTARSSICVDLERRLVAETSNSGPNARSRLPDLDARIASLRRSLNSAENRLERGGCYEEFLFTRSLRRSPKCLRIARQRDSERRDLAELEAERQQIASQSNQSYQDEIIRELARNNCGPSYAQEAQRRQRSAFNPFWEDGEGGSGYANSYQSLPFATYRTLCVRMCDGYYFPVSFSTLPNHFERDAEACQSKCAAPASLYYHQNPGAGVEQMLSFSTNEPYTQLKSAFLYRKKYVDGCSCKQAEYVPQTTVPGVPAPQPVEGYNPGDRVENQTGGAGFSPYR